VSERATATKTALAAVPARPAAAQNLFQEIDRIYDSISRRAYEIFEGGGSIFGRELDDWFKAESELLHPLRVNMQETDDAITVHAEVPGFTAKDLEIQLEPERLTITGKRETKEEQKKGKAIYQEHRANEILRVFDLPAPVDAERSSATLKDGMLELRLPKSPKAKGTRVEVKAG